jgi:protein-tyrosine kinase
MVNSNRPRFESPSLEREHKEASVFTPLDMGASAFTHLSPEVVMRKGRMGDAYIKSNKLTRSEVDEIVQLQNRLHIRFGEAAVRLGLLTEEEVRDVLDKQFNYASFAAKENSTKISSTLAIVHAPGSEDAEAIKRLRSEVLARLVDDSTIAIAIVSPVKREGKSHMAASLAIAFAQLNIKTMLIDANLRVPVQHKLFGLSNQTGLSTMLAKRSAMSLETVPEVMPQFWVLGSGPLPPNPLEMLSAPKFVQLLEHFSKQVSVFVVDTPSTLQWADAQVIARQTGRALLVARENVTKLSDLKKTKNDLLVGGVDVLGTVYNKPSKQPLPASGGFIGALLIRFQWLASLLARNPKGGV